MSRVYPTSVTPCKNGWMDVERQLYYYQENIDSPGKSRAGIISVEASVAAAPGEK